MLLSTVVLLKHSDCKEKDERKPLLYLGSRARAEDTALSCWRLEPKTKHARAGSGNGAIRMGAKHGQLSGYLDGLLSAGCAHLL